MKSITIHNLDDALAETIARRAETKGISMNAAIKRILSDALGIGDAGEGDRPRRGYLRFAHLWTEEDLAEFRKATADLEKIDPADWE